MRVNVPELRVTDKHLAVTWQGRGQQLIGQQLQVLQGDVADGGNVEQPREGCAGFWGAKMLSSAMRQ